MGDHVARVFDRQLNCCEQTSAELRMPFRVTGTEGRFNAMIKVEGGGVTGQAGAIRHGIARALLELDPLHRPDQPFLATSPAISGRLPGSAQGFRPRA